jgi:hypothetical protein
MQTAQSHPHSFTPATQVRTGSSGSLLERFLRALRLALCTFAA